MTPEEARQELERCGVDPKADFHSLRLGVVLALYDSAERHRYRLPRNAGGSRVRYWHAKLIRLASK